MAPLGRSQERSSIDVIGLWLSAEVNLPGEGGGGHVYAIVSALIYGFAFLLFDPVCSCSTQTEVQRCRGKFFSLWNSSRGGGGRVLALSSENSMCSGLVENAWTQCSLLGPVNNY